MTAVIKLARFRVTGFRSVDDSGWVETDNVTALIGTNEAGKTNLLLPLWKFNPANEGEIDPVPDYPRKHYGSLRDQSPKAVFITVVFELGDGLVAELATLTGASRQELRIVEVQRRFSGEYIVNFPDASPARSVARNRLSALLDVAEREIGRAEPLRTETAQKARMLDAIAEARAAIIGSSLSDRAESGSDKEHNAKPASEDSVSAPDVHAAMARLAEVSVDDASSRSTIAPHYATLSDGFAAIAKEVSEPHPNTNVEAINAVVERLPKFVYYSNYGNLDSELYLPQVIENLSRTDLGLKEAAKARTLKVLFEFVKLRPAEILELGRDFQPPANQPQRKPTNEEVEAIAANKKERSVLLQSAGTDLTMRFRKWWAQGEYRFRFEADGAHFRIWVSDEKRPEEIELEGRSTGLQWFLSFYLTFLVESADAHAGAILLLDEPGHSLHPLAQRDLSEFFDQLSAGNQLLYTTHSPFLVDPDHLDRVRAVYVDETGATVTSPNLRAAEGKVAQSRSIYAVWAAVGLTISDTLLLGSQVVVVEGQSDQFYLSAVKTLLVAAGRLLPQREIVFIPAGGTKGVAAVVAITTGVDEELPFVLLDGDGPGKRLGLQLRSGIYARNPERLLSVDEFAGMEGAEIEDIIPMAIIAPEVRRIVRGGDTDFDEVATEGVPIVGQIEQYAASAAIALEQGWKVDLARRVKARLLRRGVSTIHPDTLDRWTKLFKHLTA